MKWAHVVGLRGVPMLLLCGAVCRSKSGVECSTSNVRSLHFCMRSRGSQCRRAAGACFMVYRRLELVKRSVLQYGHRPQILKRLVLEPQTHGRIQ